MKRWTLFVLAGGALTLVIGLTAFQRSRVPAPPLYTYDAPPPEIPRIVAAMARKRQIAAEVVAGRLSLLQAAAAFRDLNAENSGHPIPRGYPGASTDEEAYCRSVIEYVAGQAPPDQSADWTRRLNEELDARLRDGTLVFPEP